MAESGLERLVCFRTSYIAIWQRLFAPVAKSSFQFKRLERHKRLSNDASKPLLSDPAQRLNVQGANTYQRLNRR